MTVRDVTKVEGGKVKSFLKNSSGKHISAMPLGSAVNTAFDTNVDPFTGSEWIRLQRDQSNYQ